MKAEGASRRCFTFNELLAVIAALLLMGSLAAPTLVEIRTMSRQSACKDSLVTMARLNILYAGDCGRYVPAASSERLRWHGELPAERSGRADFTKSPLAKYLSKHERLRACPLFEDVISLSPPAAEKGGFGYGYNENIGSQRAVSADLDMWTPECRGSGIAPSEIQSPQKTLMFAESASRADLLGDPDVNGTLVEMSFIRSFDTYNRGRPCWGSPDPTTHFRHGGQAASAWADGRLSMEPMGASKDGWPAGGIGYIGSRSKPCFVPKTPQRKEEP